MIEKQAFIKTFIEEMLTREEAKNCYNLTRRLIDNSMFYYNKEFFNELKSAKSKKYSVALTGNTH